MSAKQHRKQLLLYPGIILCLLNKLKHNTLPTKINWSIILCLANTLLCLSKNRTLLTDNSTLPDWEWYFANKE